MKSHIGLTMALIFAFIHFTTSEQAYAQERSPNKLTFSMPDNDGIVISYISSVFDEVSQRTNIAIAIEILPKERAILSAEKGLVDGVGARVGGLEGEGSNLKMIGVPIFTVQHAVFAKNPKIIASVNDLDSLIQHAIGNDYVVGYLLGSKKAERELSGLPDKNKKYFLKPNRAFELLEMNRLGAYVAGPAIVNRKILKNDFPNAGIVEVAVLYDFDLFPYVHKKHNALVPELERAIKSMADDGTLLRLNPKYKQH